VWPIFSKCLYISPYPRIWYGSTVCCRVTIIFEIWLEILSSIRNFTGSIWKFWKWEMPILKLCLKKWKVGPEKISLRKFFFWSGRENYRHSNFEKFSVQCRFGYHGWGFVKCCRCVMLTMLFTMLCRIYSKGPSSMEVFWAIRLTDGTLWLAAHDLKLVFQRWLLFLVQFKMRANQYFSKPSPFNQSSHFQPRNVFQDYFREFNTTGFQILDDYSQSFFIPSSSGVSQYTGFFFKIEKSRRTLYFSTPIVRNCNHTWKHFPLPVYADYLLLSLFRPLFPLLVNPIFWARGPQQNRIVENILQTLRLILVIIPVSTLGWTDLNAKCVHSWQFGAHLA
jgi:hypothetical protein